MKKLKIDRTERSEKTKTKRTARLLKIGKGAATIFLVIQNKVDVLGMLCPNFGKGIKSQDLVWYAKIEQGRSHSHQDRVVQVGEIAKSQAKEGPQTHVHIIVSRTENSARYQERKQAGELDRKNPLKLSPATYHRNTSQGAVTGGFDRTAFK